MSNAQRTQAISGIAHQMVQRGFHSAKAALESIEGPHWIIRFYNDLPTNQKRTNLLKAAEAQAKVIEAEELERKTQIAQDTQRRAEREAEIKLTLDAWVAGIEAITDPAQRRAAYRTMYNLLDPYNRHRERSAAVDEAQRDLLRTGRA